MGNTRKILGGNPIVIAFHKEKNGKMKLINV
jgi:hypothetical protein